MFQAVDSGHHGFMNVVSIVLRVPVEENEFGNYLGENVAIRCCHMTGRVWHRTKTLCRVSTSGVVVLDVFACRYSFHSEKKPFARQT